MPSPEHPLPSPRWLRVCARVLAGALVALVVVQVLTASGSTALYGRLGGDLPAFVGAGRMVLEGQVDLLYDWPAQAVAQEGMHGRDTGDFLPFVYPPFVAAAYAPLARLPWRAAYALHTLLMAAALWCAARLAAGTRPRPFLDVTGAACAALLFFPLMRGVTGGQNTALSVLLVAVTWWALHQRRELLAGTSAGLLLFKPQLALPLLGLLLLGRCWRAVGAALGVGAGLYLAGAAVAGWGWPAHWWSQLSGFHAADQAVNAANSVGLLGLSEALLGPGSLPALVLGGVLTAVAVAAVSWAWLRRERVPLHLRVGLAAAGMALIPPHSMYYDAGLALLTLWAVAAHRGRAALPGLLGLGAAALLGQLAPDLGFNPLSGVVLAAGAWALVLAREASAQPGQTASLSVG